MEKPALRCLVSLPLAPALFTPPVLVSLELAEELYQKGYIVLVDPQDQSDLALWERIERSRRPKRKWFER